MDNSYGQWSHPYKPEPEFSKRVAYFSMEFGIDQGLKIYSGGLGFLAGSHMRSAHLLKQNIIGIGILWKYGYYDQGRKKDRSMEARWIEKNYSFLEDTGIEVSIRVHNNSAVKVKAYVLRPEIFNTAPIYLLSTDVEGNDYLARSISHTLYDNHENTRIAQNILLGIGGAKVVQALGGADIYHLNEGHGLPAFYYLKNNGVKKSQFVFTTHTPEKGGNAERNGTYLNEFGFFGKQLSEKELSQETVQGGVLSYTVAALRNAIRANAVSKLHAKVATNMWKNYKGVSKIIPITNSQDRVYWQDNGMAKAWEKRDARAFRKAKNIWKQRLCQEVLDQTGKLFRPDVLTLVWARRFAAYKRADLLLRDWERFQKLIHNQKYPVQIIWAGKPYPLDQYGIDIFDHLARTTKYQPNLALLTGYELSLSKLLKSGSDIWLNTPRITREASGTSGMTAAMNGSVNLSVNDGWVPEFAKHGLNSFIFPEVSHHLPLEEQDDIDSQNLYRLLEEEVLPIFYEDPSQWDQIVFNAIDDVLPEFDSQRMAREYYEKLYK
ncbi:MAG: alpha-glucan family phosphorylase [Eudoraea sp.]|nr:alpha-glucan family phosphorylase [Eudoraea sp.]